MHLREWVLLAWAQVQPHPRPLSQWRGEYGLGELGVLQDSEVEQGVLGGEDSQEQGAGQRGAAEAGGNGVALHNCVGM